MNIEIIKKMHNLQGRELHWAIIEEKTLSSITYKPGFVIEGSELVLDLLARRFFSAINLPEFQRNIYLADQIENEMVAIVAKEDPSKQTILPASFLDDVYQPAWYTPSLEEQILI